MKVRLDVLPPISTSRFADDHSHRPVLAPATLAALPSTRAIPDRYVFYAWHAVASAKVGRSRPRGSVHSLPLGPTASLAVPRLRDRSSHSLHSLSSVPLMMFRE